MTRFFIPMALSVVLFAGCKQPAPTEPATATAPPKVTSTGTVGLEIGNVAPELAFQSPDGKTLTLSSLRGKLVLVDFWASWCMPCRMENPNVVRMYQQYKDATFTEGKGFTVYSVSLDKNRKNWLDAIQRDKLEWDNHVSDLLGWDSAPAAAYQISSIPSNFLLNAEGVIIAKNLRAAALEEKIKSLVK
jgi:thiol-disulfide isomerase/thioredoxin